MEDIPLKNGIEFTPRSSVLDHTSYIAGGSRLAGFGTQWYWTLHSCRSRKFTRGACCNLAPITLRLGAWALPLLGWSHGVIPRTSCELASKLLHHSKLQFPCL